MLSLVVSSAGWWEARPRALSWALRVPSAGCTAPELRCRRRAGRPSLPARLSGRSLSCNVDVGRPLGAAGRPAD